MLPESQRLTADDRENLVAYLDGELNEAEQRALATKLTQSISARREIEALQATWELLEHLPRPSLSPEFTAHTLSEIDRAPETWSRTLLPWARFLLRAAACLLAALFMFGAGFVATRYLWPDPTSRLADRLSLAEHLDEYRAIGGDFEFLRQLDRIPEFNVERD